MDKKLEDVYNRTLIRCMLSGQRTSVSCKDLINGNRCPLDNTEMACDRDCRRTLEEWKRWLYKLSEHADNDERTLNDIIDEVKHALTKQDREQYIR